MRFEYLVFVMKGVLIVGAWSRAELLIFVCTCREAYVRLCPHPTTGNAFAPFRFLLTIVVSSRYLLPFFFFYLFYQFLIPTISLYNKKLKF
jgi:hypothetical protein